MIKILMDARVAGYRPSGIGMYIYYLVKELKKYPDLSFVLITDVIESNEMKEFQNDGIKICSYGKLVAKSWQVFSYFSYVQKCIQLERPDIFWEGNEVSPIKLKNPAGKMFTTIYDMFPIETPQHFSRTYPAYFRHGIHIDLKYFDFFIYDSMECKKETEKYFPKAKEKTSFVGYVIVPKMSEIEIGDNQDFLYVGNLETRKGTDILLEAYRAYRRKGGIRGLRLAGKVRDQQIDQLMKEVKKDVPGLSYLGYVSKEERDQEYAQCHCFLFPSRAEGFGIPIIEAMNYNKPVIAGDLMTLREVAGNCISYFPLSENVQESSDRLAELMLKDENVVDIPAYESVIEHYTAENVGKRYYEMIKRVAKI